MRTYISKVLFTIALCLISTFNFGEAVLDREVRWIDYTEIVAKAFEAKRYNALDSAIGINSRYYLNKLGMMESGNNYAITNRYGYMGKYQFGKRTLHGLVRVGYLDLTKEEIDNFVRIPQAQERAIDALLHANNDYLNRYGINKYIGRTIGGVKITKEGLLAASHLVGGYAVVHFCKTGSLQPVTTKNGITVKKHDGNGVYLTEYMRKFNT